MDAKLKQKWVEALRSGEFTQTTCQLVDRSGGRCCLGVLCYVAEVPTEDDSCFAYDEMTRLTGNYGPFVRMNDDEGKSFPEIADYIEGHL